MKHYIIIKWNDEMPDKEKALRDLRAEFGKVNEIPGIKSAFVYGNCIARDNRSDVMIRIDMEKEALPTWDAAPQHNNFKSTYNKYIGAKAVFDTED